MLQRAPRGSVVPYRVNFSRRQAAGAVASGIGGYLGRGWGYRAVRGIGRYIGSLQRNNPVAYQSQVSSMKRLRSKRKFSNQPSAGTKKRKVTLKSRVKNLEKKTKDILSTSVYRKVETSQIKTTNNVSTYGYYVANYATMYEQALSQLKYYDPATPGTLVTAAGASGTYERAFKVRGYSKLTLKNNYQIPVDVRVYTYTCVSDTNQDPITWLDGCLLDNASATKASPLIFPTDAKDMGDLWKLQGTKSWIMQAGAVRTISKGTPEISYDPSEYDNHPLLFQPDFKSYAFVVRVTGILAHDKTTITQVGYASGGVDVTHHTTYTSRYSAGGPSITYTYVDTTGLAAMAAGPLTSQVVRDNQEYSAT